MTSIRPFFPISLAALALGMSSCTEIRPTADPGEAAMVSTGKGQTALPSEGSFAIDLPTTLKLAAGRNLELATAVEQANRAVARADAAALSILPDLAVGASFAEQNGLLQETTGAPANVQRVNDSLGFGTSSGQPGVSLNLSLGKAIFAPLAARQDRRAALSAAEAMEHQVMANAAAAYYELVRARAAVQLARDIEAAAGQLAEATKSFAEAGEGLAADSERSAATHLLRRGQSLRAEAELVRRSNALARILHLPATLTLIPTDTKIAPTHLVNPDEPAGRLVATALKFRPETARLQAEVAAAAHRLTEQKIKPFLPNIGASYSNFDFAAGQGKSTDANDSREEVAALIYWKLEGLGFGQAAANREKTADLKLARLREAAVLDAIAADVTAARAETLAQRARLPIGAQAANHARKAYQLTAERLQQAQGLPIEALASIQTLAEARQAEIDAVLDYNIAQHRLLEALGHPSESGNQKH